MFVQSMPEEFRACLIGGTDEGLVVLEKATQDARSYALLLRTRRLLKVIHHGVPPIVNGGFLTRRAPIRPWLGAHLLGRDV